MWTGFDQKEALGLTGAEASLPAWTNFMKAATAPRPALDFGIPPGIVVANVDPQTGDLAARLPGNDRGRISEGAGADTDLRYDIRLWITSWRHWNWRGREIRRRRRTRGHRLTTDGDDTIEVRRFFGGD